VKKNNFNITFIIVWFSFIFSIKAYSKQLDFRLGVEKRAPGVYTLVHEDVSDENNNAQNSSAKSISAFPYLNSSLSPYEITNLLGWIPTGTNLCGGYYKEPAIVLSCSNPPEFNAATTTITADRSVSFSVIGTSKLEGNVTVTQPGRKMTAERALLYRDSTTHEISQILLEGNVHFYEPGKHVFAESVYVDLQKKYVQLDHALYRFAKPTQCEVLNAWGQAESAIRKSNQEVIFRNASYTTCSPVNRTWQIIAERLDINRESGWGEAVNTALYFYNTPLLWIPYFSFPVDKRRKTGFLFPTVGYSNDGGFHIGLPYYLNLAPNYDATLIPNYIFRRGIELESHFRYLTPHSLGYANIEYIPYDMKFASFRRRAPTVFGTDPSNLPFLERLAAASNSRGMFSLVDYTVFNSHWWGNLNLNYVTDDYYLQDFAYNPYNSSKDQLLNQLEVNYSSDDWHFLGRLQTYRTLHPINQQPILDQYSKVPQLAIESDFPELPNRLNFQANGEFIYFDHPSDFISQLPMTTGQRLHVQPSISLPLINPFSFFVPKLQIDGTFYNLKDNPYRTSHIARVLPLFSVDSGIYLERNFGCYQQTLEPRLFYLFVPETNQNNIPIFDTTLPAFNVDQLFRINRFIGYDRLGDANQLSIALTTRFLNCDSGEQRVRATIGETIYFKSPRVCLTPNCNNDFYVHKSLSPLVGELNCYLNAYWDSVASVAIDPEDYGLNNASVNFHYHPDRKHIFNIGYEFVRKGDILTTYALDSSHNNLNRLNLALAWELNNHWQAFANCNYNLSHGYPQAYFYGLQYDSCCWAMRIVASRILTAENRNNLATYQTNYYVQLQLKGLGNVGNSDPGNLLTSSIFGYQDMFKG
jgi:LPS-assembly protein